MALAQALYERFRRPLYEFGKFAVVGITGVFITNAVYDLLYLHHGVGPVLSTTIATLVAMVATYLGNRYWSFRSRQRSGVAREVVAFAVLNGIGLLIQDATVAFNYYLLGLGHDKLAVFVALNLGIAAATLFRFWSYRQFVWGSVTRLPRSAGRPAGPQHAAAGSVSDNVNATLILLRSHVIAQFTAGFPTAPRARPRIGAWLSALSSKNSILVLL